MKFEFNATSWHDFETLWHDFTRPKPCL